MSEINLSGMSDEVLDLRVTETYDENQIQVLDNGVLQPWTQD